MDRWQQIESLFQEALERDTQHRDAFLREACVGDAELEREVRSLLAHHAEDAGGEFWAAQAAAQLIDAGVSLEAGRLLGPYRIESFVAAGGMGEVYRATDTRLGREVAIKVSAARFSKRFGTEATVIASLNHPHICRLYDVGPNYLVMELLEGTPLRGPLPLRQAIEYAGQILDALGFAHRKGITHRDLKPGNILMTKQGVKLLDFGLARKSGNLQETDATLTSALTGKGQIIGTLQYMSPEQLQGKDADARSDLFSFGCVFYEMLTGKRAFQGESTASVIAAILEREPAPLNLAPPLERLIQICLAKDPDLRFQNALDLKRALSWAVEQPVAAKANRKWIGAAAAALVFGALGVGWGLLHVPRPAPVDDRVIRFQVAPPVGGGIMGAGNLGGGLAISPDGQTVAFVAVVQGKVGLWLRPLEAANPRLVPGSDGAARPFWSPDSGSVAFFAGGALQRLDLSRQTISKICDVDRVYWGGSWSSDGRILFAIRDVGIFQVPASGGAATQVTILDREHGEVNHVLPQVLPGGRFLYSVMSPTPGVYAASLDKPAERIRLVANAGEARYAPGAGGTDYLLWIRDRALMARRFDADKLQLLGEPHQLADPVAIASSGGDVLLYGSSVSLRKFKWLDRRGNDAGSLGEPGPWVFNRISHDGRRVVTVRAGNPSDLWLLETGRGVASRLTSGPGSHISPVWSPDGRTILYSTGSPFNLFRISSDGAGGEERLTQSPRAQRAQDWSRDGRLLLFAEDGLDTGIDLWVLPVTPEGRPAQGAKPRLYLGERFDQSQGRFSPDGHWVAYQSNESGQSEVYVRSFPEGTDKICLSKGGGIYPEWGPGGRELYYQSPDGKLMLVTLKTTSSSLEAQLPHELFALPNSYSVPGGYEAASDGQRFLVGDVVASPEPLTVIVNWRALLRKGR